MLARHFKRCRFTASSKVTVGPGNVKRTVYVGLQVETGGSEKFKTAENRLKLNLDILLSVIGIYNTSVLKFSDGEE